MYKAEFLNEMGRILETDVGSLTDDQPIEPVYWDSIEVLGTIELIDRAGVTVKVGDILACETVGDILRLSGF